MTASHLEVTTVGIDFAVLHEVTGDGVHVHHLDGLPADSEVTAHGDTFRTLAHPGGALLCRFATVNDVHFGETRAGHIDGMGADRGTTIMVEDGEPPYPWTMNDGACTEMAAIAPSAVVVKGDLTADGSEAELTEFLECYGRFGDRLWYVRGNHDAYRGQDFAAWPAQRVDLPGVTLAIVDTAIPRMPSGALTTGQIDWLDDLAADGDRPVLVFGHHHMWNPDSNQRPDGYFGVHPDWSERFVELVARRPAIAGYFAGHTHRNRVRRFAATGDVPFVEVACVKDFPGSWAEYQVYEGGVVQLHHRISTPEALRWSERCRAMFGGAYPDYSFGTIEDRCFMISV